MVIFANENDIDSWMKLVREVRWNFPGLETEKSLTEHRQTVLKFIKSGEAICIMDGSKMAAVLLFSKEHNMICFLAVLPEYRKRGYASELMKTALESLDRTKEISVSTFREDDEKGTAPRTLYKKFGFIEGELMEEFGYPNQKFILKPYN